MTSTAPTVAAPTLSLTLGLDRKLAWAEGGSVRYAIADLAATGAPAARAEAPALNLALVVDVSGSMAGDKIAAARDTAAAVTQALTARDRLTLVAFDSTAELLLDARPMDEAGRRAALAAIRRLEPRGGTNLWEGWLLGNERVAVAMDADPKASHRVLLLSDGQANEGVTARSELAHHAGELQARGIITSAVGIGDGYDEALLGAMAEAGGGRLHDAEIPREIGEVVLGELLEGRAALLERTTLRIAVPANLRAEVVGAWSHTVLPGAIDVLVGALLPDSPRRVVIRLHCPAGAPGTTVLLGASAGGALPDGSGLIEAEPVEAELRLAHGHDNTAQERDIERSLAAFTAWQAEAMRRAVGLNREGDRRGAKHFLERELRWLERYARGLPGAEPLLAELVLLLRRAEEDLDPRLRKELYAASMMRARHEKDLRSAPRAPLADMLRREPRR
ncbi:vWA domain-containing protein [Roseomonas rosulenta]|uniref:vWA domain-containing protein n=1 Tax=Roseomonas rosulenta TaxID=2748667 RepID=UPI0018DFD290|nr:VWA domain-containing protein [Roseomonas rosulenta]